MAAISVLSVNLLALSQFNAVGTILNSALTHPRSHQESRSILVLSIFLGVYRHWQDGIALTVTYLLWVTTQGIIIYHHVGGLGVRYCSTSLAGQITTHYWCQTLDSRFTYPNSTPSCGDRIKTQISSVVPPIFIKLTPRLIRSLFL